MPSDPSAPAMRQPAPGTRADPDLQARQRYLETRRAKTSGTQAFPPVRPDFARSEDRIYSQAFLEHLQFEDARQALPIQESNCSLQNLLSPVTNRTVCELAGRINLAGASEPCRVAMAFQTPFHMK